MSTLTPEEAIDRIRASLHWSGVADYPLVGLEEAGRLLLLIEMAVRNEENRDLTGFCDAIKWAADQAETRVHEARALLELIRTTAYAQSKGAAV